MSHTFTRPEVSFHYNPDGSGNVCVQRPFGAHVYVSMADLRAFVAYVDSLDPSPPPVEKEAENRQVSVSEKRIGLLEDLVIALYERTAFLRGAPISPPDAMGRIERGWLADAEYAVREIRQLRKEAK